MLNLDKAIDLIKRHYCSVKPELLEFYIDTVNEMWNFPDGIETEEFIARWERWLEEKQDLIEIISCRGVIL